MTVFMTVVTATGMTWLLYAFRNAVFSCGSHRRAWEARVFKRVRLHYLLQFVGENKTDDVCVYENEDEIWESIEWVKNSGSENLIPWGYGNSIDIFLNA